MSPSDVQNVMQKLDVDKILMLSHTQISFSEIGADDRRPIVLARAYMEFMLNQVVDTDQGVYTAIPIPHHDPEESVELIDDYGYEDGSLESASLQRDPSPR